MHPAKFSPNVLRVCARYAYGRVLDPFAGTGRVHDLRDLSCAVRDTIALELEWEWASNRKGFMNVQGNAFALPFPSASFDCIVTSPTYGNRLADHHNARDASVRHSYTHDIGHALHPDNTGQVHWGERYRMMHEAMLLEMRRVLRGLLVLNVSDHIRNWEVQPIGRWWRDATQRAGFAFIACIQADTPRLRFGENFEARADNEYVLVSRVGKSVVREGERMGGTREARGVTPANVPGDRRGELEKARSVPHKLVSGH